MSAIPKLKETREQQTRCFIDEIIHEAIRQQLIAYISCDDHVVVESDVHPGGQIATIMMGYGLRDVRWFAGVAHVLPSRRIAHITLADPDDEWQIKAEKLKDNSLAITVRKK